VDWKKMLEPSSFDNEESVSGPRMFAIATSMFLRTNMRASAVPILAEPIMAYFMKISSLSCVDLLELRVAGLSGGGAAIDRQVDASDEATLVGSDTAADASSSAVPSRPIGIIFRKYSLVPSGDPLEPT
jgi:hypothetical protein